MSVTLAQRRGTSSQPWPLARLASLAALLAAEAIALSWRFDAENLVDTGEWWTKLLRHALIPRIVIAFAASVLVFGFTQVRQELLKGAEPGRQRRRPWAWLAGHLAALAGFYGTTARLLEGDVRSASSPGAWFLLWAALGAATLACWALALLPLDSWRRLAPVVPVAVAVGAAAGAAYKFNLAWRPLSESTLWVVRLWLRLFGLETVDSSDGPGTGTAEFDALIDRECSGYEGVGLILVFLGVYLWVFRDRLRFPQAFLLLPVGAALSWLGNTLRIAVLIALGTWVSPDIAAGGFHSQAGWLAFNGIALGLVLVTRRSAFFSISRPGSDAAGAENRTAPFLVPFLAVVAAGMVAAAFSTGKFETWYPLRVVAAGACLWYYRAAYRKWTWAWSWPAAAVGAAVFLMWIGLDALLADDTGAAPLAPPGVAAGWLALWVVCRVIGSVVTVPLAEELAFRGYLTRRLIAAEFWRLPPGSFTWFSFLGSSVLFGVLHGRWVAGVVAGMAYAVMLYRRGRVADAVVAHATTNGLLSAFVLATGRWSLWS